MRRVAVVASHPVQYQAPWFRALAAVCDLTVFYAHRQDAGGQAAAGFGQPFEWDIPLLDGYRFEWLQNVSAAPGVGSFAGCDTPQIRDVLAAGRFDACIVTGWYLKSYLQAIRACRRLGIPVLVRGDSHLRSPRPALTRAAKYLPYRWLLGRVDAHLYVGTANREYLQHYGVEEARLFFAPHFVENGRFAAAARLARESGVASQLRRSWSADAGTTVFLFAGKLLAGKRAKDLVDAVALLSRQGHDVRAVLVGSGPEEAALRSRTVRETAPVHFAGFQNQSGIAQWYAAADCLVLPSAAESWGLVVNEAMATGLPAIVSDQVGCAVDLVTEGETGFVFPAGDAYALAAQMTCLMNQRAGRRPAMREAVLRRINQYTCDAAVDGTMRALDAVTNRARRQTEPATAELNV